MSAIHIKQFLNDYAVKKKLGTPRYDLLREDRPMKANGAISSQPSGFHVSLKCLKINGIDEEVPGFGKSIKLAQIEAAKSMCRKLLEQGKISQHQLERVVFGSEIIEEMKTPVEKIRDKYQSWGNSSEVQEGNVVVEKRPEKRHLNDSGLVFYGSKRVRKDESESTTTVTDSGLGSCSPEVIHISSDSEEQPASSKSTDQEFIGPVLPNCEPKQSQNIAADDTLHPTTLIRSQSSVVLPQDRERECRFVRNQSDTLVVHIDKHDQSDLSQNPETALPTDDDNDEDQEDGDDVIWEEFGIDTADEGASPSSMKNKAVRDSFDSVLTNPQKKQLALCRSLGEKMRQKFSKKMSVLSQKIQEHYEINKQSEEIFNWKMSIRQVLIRCLREIMPNSGLFVVGSTMNGLGSYNSDMDCCLVVDGLDNNRRFALDVLRDAHRYLRNRKINLPIHVYDAEIIPAKVPLLRMKIKNPHLDEDLEVDMNCNNIAGIYNSHLLHYYAKFDWRFPALALIVKHWAIKANINDAMGGTFNSYSLILLVLHFLQTVCRPAVLPNLQHLYPQMFNGNQPLNSLSLHHELPYPPPGVGRNRQSVGELLVELMFYFGKVINFKHQAISIRGAEIFSRRRLPLDSMRYHIFVEEPFDGCNTARCVLNKGQYRRIVASFKSACMTLVRNPSLEAIGVEI